MAPTTRFQTNARARRPRINERQGAGRPRGPEATRGDSRRSARPLSNSASVRCAQCEAEFPRTCERNRHEREQHGHFRPNGQRRRSAFDEEDEADKTWKCPHCGLEFRSQNRATHLRTHSSIRGFKCRQCSSRFKHTQSRNRHEVAKHVFDRFRDEQEESEVPRTSLKTRPCCHCGVAYPASILWKHERTHARAGGHECRVCGAAFSDASGRRRHERKFHAFDPHAAGAAEEQKDEGAAVAGWEEADETVDQPTSELQQQSAQRSSSLDVFEQLQQQPLLLYFDLDYGRRQFGTSLVDAWIAQPAAKLLVLRTNSADIADCELPRLPPPVFSAEMHRWELPETADRDRRAFAHVFAKPDAAEFADQLEREMGDELPFEEFAAEVLPAFHVRSALLVASSVDRNRIAADRELLAARGIHVF